MAWEIIITCCDKDIIRVICLCCRCNRIKCIIYRYICDNCIFKDSPLRNGLITCKYSAYVSPEICSSLNVNAGEVSMEIAFISGMPNPLDVNDGVIVRVDFRRCLNECPTVPF